MRKILIPVLAFNLLAMYACQNKQNNTETNITPPINSNYSWMGKSASLVDVNANDGFEENGYGAIDSILVQKLFAGVFSGAYTAVQDNAERLPLSKEEIITELKNSANKNNIDNSKKNFFVDADGEKISMRDIIQILTKDSLFLQEPGFNLIRKTQEIAIVAQTYDQEGNERGKRILFWILLNEPNKA